MNSSKALQPTDGASPERRSIYAGGARLERFRDRYGLSALMIYAALSFGFIGRSITGGLSSRYIGRSNDPTVYMWLLSWWPYAIAHRLNPMITYAVWAPDGFNLAWTTSMPLPALLAAPLTNAFGPVVAYNVLCILAPAAAAWGCFLLCRRITADYLAAAAGGYVFGFSAYMLAETRGHLPLVLVFPVPLALLLLLKRLEGSIGSFWFSILLGVVLATAFLCWAELYATMALFGAVALGLALFFGGDAMRQRLRDLLIPIGAAYALSLIVVLPYLYYFFQPGYPRSPINSPRMYSADLLNLLFPTLVNALGGIGFVENIARRFGANSLETSAYFGLPLIAIALWFAWERWREPMTRVLVTFLVIVCVLMLGPRLHVNGHELFGMPWKIASHLPLLRHALPVRFSLYAFLGLAIIVSMWLSAPRPAGVKLAAIVLLAIFLCPNLHSGFWSRNNDTPEFFMRDDYLRYLKPGENIIALPYGINGSSMLWQAAAAFYFRMAGGWTSITPHEFQSWPIVGAMLTRTYIPEMTLQLHAFMAAHGVRTILVTDSEAEFWHPMLAPLDSSPIRSGGVVVYSTSPGKLPAFQAQSALEMERRSNLARFSALLRAAHEYIAQNEDMAELTPMRAQEKGLLPPHWVTDPDVRTNNGLYLGPWDGNKVALGVVGTYWGLQPLIEKYHAAAAKIFFPFPKRLTEPPEGDTFMRLLVMVFDRNGLAQAILTAESIR
ncbi:MAG: hypothetical protein JO189_01150 [Deltaproteobacteria bacterium]|nr:hypothetical protein [Deltaproteobacteria bacterium]